MARRFAGAALLVLRAAALTGQECCDSGGIPFGPDCVDHSEVYQRAKTFLLENMPGPDVANKLNVMSTDCCHNSILNSTLTSALFAKCEYEFAHDVPEDVWLNWALPYANLNEPRVDWPKRFMEMFGHLVFKESNLQEAVLSLNNATGGIWNSPLGQINFQADNTPSIMDPFSVMAFGYASCTGFSIYLVDALRTFGIPARVVGTPAWHGNPDEGNHNWVEVWNGASSAEKWVFLEGQESESCNYGVEGWSPGCWFCDAAHFSNHTMAYAAAWDRRMPRMPLPWAPGYEEVPGVDRSAWYVRKCGGAIYE